MSKKYLDVRAKISTKYGMPKILNIYKIWYEEIVFLDMRNCLCSWKSVSTMPACVLTREPMAAELRR